MQWIKGFSIIFVMAGLLMALPANATSDGVTENSSDNIEVKSSETAKKGDKESKRHISCQVECEKDGEDPYQCEEFCVVTAALDCHAPATMTGALYSKR